MEPSATSEQEPALNITGSPPLARRLSLGAWLAKAYLSLLPVHPPAYYTQPVPLVRPREEYSDEVQAGFLTWFPPLLGTTIDLEDKRVLDLGSGFGGRTVRYKELGARQVIGLEVGIGPAQDGARLASERSAPVSFVVGVGEKLPFRDSCFDVIVCYDVLEHVEDVEAVLCEAWRVLAPSGTMYAVFPPFFHPTGGSHLHGFVSRAPLCNLLFPSRTLMAAAEAILEERNDPFRPRPLRPKDRLWTLNGVTIRSFRRILRATRFSRKRVAYAPMCAPSWKKWGPWRMKYWAFAVWPLRRVPIVNELFVDRIVCALTK